MGPYAYYVVNVKIGGKYMKRSTYIGRVPAWYVPLFSKEAVTTAKEAIQ